MWISYCRADHLCRLIAGHDRAREIDREPIKSVAAAAGGRVNTCGEQSEEPGRQGESCPIPVIRRSRVSSASFARCACRAAPADGFQASAAWWVEPGGNV